MTMTREHALAALGLGASVDVNEIAIQRAFERLARRYPQPHFPDRFRQLLDARDRLLNAGRAWRAQLESSTLDLSWVVRYLEPIASVADNDDRSSMQKLLRAAFLAEPLSRGFIDEFMEEDEGDTPF